MSEKNVHIDDLLQYEGEEFITHLYENLLFRSPDKEGFSYHLNRLVQGVPKQKVIIDFYKSPECSQKGAYLVEYEECDAGKLAAYPDEEFIGKCYHQLLHRDFDPAGYENYLKRLSSGEASKEDIIYAIRYSPEGEKVGVKLVNFRFKLSGGRIFFEDARVGLGSLLNTVKFTNSSC